MEGQCHSRGGSTYFAFWRCMVFWILDMVYAGVQSPLGSAYESKGYGKDVTRILTSQAADPGSFRRTLSGPPKALDIPHVFMKGTCAVDERTITSPKTIHKLYRKA